MSGAVTQFDAKKRAALARELDLPPDVFGLLPVGWGYDWSNWGCWWFPETDGAGTIIGISSRYVGQGKRCGNGDRKKKACLPGSRRGLLVTKRWDGDNAAIFLPEGASDTLALLAMGLCAIGRPNCSGGTAYAAKMLANTKRTIVVVGDNDKPGGEGAGKCAQGLANELNRPVLVAYPEKGYKDSRAWLNAKAPGLHESTLADPRLAKAGRQYARLLLANAKLVKQAKKGCVRDLLKEKRYEKRRLANLGQAEAPRACFNVHRPCMRAKIQHMGHYDKPDDESAVQPTCKGWRCPGCRERKKQEWLDRWFLTLSQADTPTYLHCLFVPRSRQQATQKAISRAGGKCFSIRHGPDGQRVLVVATVGLRTSEKVEKGKTADFAFEAMGQIDNCRGKPISSTRGWLPPLPKKPATMFRIGPVNRTKEEILSGLEKGDLRYWPWPTHKRGAYSFGVSWGYPPDMNEDQRRRHANRLLGHTVELTPLDDCELFVTNPASVG